MTTLYLILVILGAACFLMAALEVAVSKINLLALGLFFLAVVQVIQLAKAL